MEFVSTEYFSAFFSSQTAKFFAVFPPPVFLLPRPQPHPGVGQPALVAEGGPVPGNL